MIVTCPACSKRYLVEDTSIDANGRQVQCVSCNHSWFFKPVPGAKELEQVHLDLIGIQSSTQKASTLNIGWFLLLITLIALGFGLVMGRSVIQDKFPFTATLYTGIGLTSQEPLEGLSFQDLRPMVEPSSDGQRLILTGVVSNTSDTVKHIDALTVVVKGDCAHATWWERFMTTTIKRKDSQQCTLEKWTYTPSEQKVYPGERVAFETSSDHPLQGARSIQIQF